MIVGCEDGSVNEILLELMIGYRNDQDNFDHFSQTDSVLDVLEVDIGQPPKTLKIADTDDHEHKDIDAESLGNKLSTSTINGNVNINANDMLGNQQIWYTYTVGKVIEICPLPVCNLWLSFQGNFMVSMHANSLLVGYDCVKGQATSHIGLDASVSGVCKVEKLNKSSPNGSDSLLVAIHGDTNIKVLDIISSKFIWTYELDSYLSLPILSCVIWFHESSEDVRKYGVCVDSNLTAYTFNGDGGVPRICHTLNRVMEVSYEGEEPSLSIENLLVGTKGFRSGSAPLLTYWNFRDLHLLLMELNFETDSMTARKTFEYRIRDPKTSIINVIPLEKSNRDRGYKFLMCLSDGTVMVITL